MIYTNLKYTQQPATSLYNPKIQLRRQSGNKLVAQCLDTVLKFLRVPSLPVGAILTGNRLITGESKVQHIVFTMTLVTVESVIRETQLCQRNGRLAGGSSAVGIAPNAVELVRLV